MDDRFISCVESIGVNVRTRDLQPGEQPAPYAIMRLVNGMLLTRSFSELSIDTTLDLLESYGLLDIVQNMKPGDPAYVFPENRRPRVRFMEDTDDEGRPNRNLVHMHLANDGDAIADMKARIAAHRGPQQPKKD